MEVMRKNAHPLNNLSLKWSFAIYVTICGITATFFSIMLSAFFGSLNQANPNDIYRILSMLVVPIVFVICIIAGGMAFYLRKLKKPLAILDEASTRIASGDLDFKVEYNINNEFGRLAASFETMRKSIYQTNCEMWRMMEGRKQLNAAFSHDLRTPLTVLQGYCDFLLKYIPEGKINGEKTISTLSTMKIYLERLEGYTATMSSLQKIGEIELVPKDMELNAICKELNNMATILAANKKFSICCGDTTMLPVDLKAVTQVFGNLISNASRYAKNEIKVTCEAKNGFLAITVADDGPGFTAEALKNATAPYFRDEKGHPNTMHFGIGLYICRVICEKHGGTLSLENDGGGKVIAKFATQLP
jgi:signal transduction histidine kinase